MYASNCKVMKFSLSLLLLLIFSLDILSKTASILNSQLSGWELFRNGLSGAPWILYSTPAAYWIKHFRGQLINWKSIVLRETKIPNLRNIKDRPSKWTERAQFLCSTYYCGCYCRERFSLDPSIWFTTFWKQRTHNG